MSQMPMIETITEWLNADCCKKENERFIWMKEDEIIAEAEGQTQFAPFETFYRTVESETEQPDLTSAVLFEQARAYGKRLFPHVLTQFPLVSSYSLDEQMIVSWSMRTPDGHALPIFEIAMTLSRTGELEQLVFPRGEVRLIPTEHKQDVEAIKQEVIQKVQPRLCYQTFDPATYQGGDGKVHLVYDVFTSQSFVHHDGRLERLFEERVSDIAVSEAQLNEVHAFIKRLDLQVAVQLCATIDQEDAIEFVFEGVIEKVPLTEELLIHLDKKTNQVSYMECPSLFYETVAIQSEPLIHPEQAIQQLAQYLHFDYRYQYDHQLIEEGVLIHVFVEGLTEIFPAAHGAIHAVDALTGEPWLVQTDGCFENQEADI